MQITRITQLARAWLASFLASLCPVLFAQTPAHVAVDEIFDRLDSLELVAAQYGCAVYFAPPAIRTSPSTVELETWQTCSIPREYQLLGVPLHQSSVYKFRVDCPAASYAQIEYTLFRRAFWHEVIERRDVRKNLGWRPMGNTTLSIFSFVCIPDGDPRRALQPFDGPGSKRSL